MVAFWCGVSSDRSVFPIDIDAGTSVGDLKAAIKHQNPTAITCDANKLLLFVTKKDGATLAA
ncbi:hypothetical protein PHYSODRAFT_530734 [Phytophthora sojae]|uniref:Crinkler effector protein N-terminal domain-containing protein n=1 Tax=Phytophthora sojae (strain P6497) TaxID=1094619 RepID=G5ABK7_PHYSP|nr:hypothetical protein PHYSODRAFT_530734 [Phytophthora sojae]EGZ06732.1 hypothetical protein PHYSODRAFT_530734 [Phytophthora sojae]|eukprot:XP_009537496.1 hypothetical protein PHYSODRAFT_530734 [Phytophthora sojae]